MRHPYARSEPQPLEPLVDVESDFFGGLLTFGVFLAFAGCIVAFAAVLSL